MVDRVEAELEIRSVSKSFAPPTLAVDDVSLSISDGETLCILGPSGSGKTTLLRMVAGLEEPDSGEITYAGNNLSGVPPHLRDFGMMFQDFALFPHLNVTDNIAFGLRMHQLPKPEIAQRVHEMLDLVALQGYESRAVDELSGGEQQRVALARALALQPRVLLLDEPLGALDRALRERLMLEIRDILTAQNITALYVTHDQLESFAIADRIAVMNEGQIEQVATPEVLYRRPANAFVARFLGFQNIIPGQVASDGRVRTAVGDFVADTGAGGSEPPRGTPVSVLIKPNVRAIRRVDEIDLDEQAGNAIDGVVSSISFRGRYYQLWLRSEEHEMLFEPEGEPAVAVGQMVRVWPDELLVYEVQ